MENLSEARSMGVENRMTTRGDGATTMLAAWSASVSAAIVALTSQAWSGDSIVYTDATLGAGLTMTYQPNPPMIPSVDEWLLGGLAVADFNNDGWPDLFVLGSGSVADRLYINNGNGTFTDMAQSWGVAAVHGGAAVCTGDFDNNGWTDLFVLSYGSQLNNQGEVGKHRLYKNNGNGTFTDVAVLAGVSLSSNIIPSGNGCCFGDYDLDGDLDLVVAGWKGAAQGNRLFRNNGNGGFTNVTGLKITFPPVTWGFTPSFADMNDDGYPELLLAADFGTSRYYTNNGLGSFIDSTVASGTGLDKEGMGQCVADFDNDGRLDWYVTSVYVDRPNPGSQNGNTLYRNLGGHLYSEIAEKSGVDDGGWGWGAVAPDVDNDGWLDLVEVNGRAAAPWLDEREYLWHNDGDGSFTEVQQSNWSFFTGDGRAVATLDFDRDGDQDLVMLFNKGPLKLYRNDSIGGHWLQLKFDTSGNPRIPPNGRLSVVRALVQGESRMRVLDGGHGYSSGSEDIVQIGLGAATKVDSLAIEFPPGYRMTLANVDADRRLTILAPSTGDFTGDGIVNGADLGTLLGQFGPVVGREGRLADLSADGQVNAVDLLLFLNYWGQ